MMTKTLRIDSNNNVIGVDKEKNYESQILVNSILEFKKEHPLYVAYPYSKKLELLAKLNLSYLFTSIILIQFDKKTLSQYNKLDPENNYELLTQLEKKSIVYQVSFDPSNETEFLEFLNYLKTKINHYILFRKEYNLEKYKEDIFNRVYDNVFANDVIENEIENLQSFIKLSSIHNDSIKKGYNSVILRDKIPLNYFDFRKVPKLIEGIYLGEYMLFLNQLKLELYEIKNKDENNASIYSEATFKTIKEIVFYFEALGINDFLKQSQNNDDKEFIGKIYLRVFNFKPNTVSQNIGRYSKSDKSYEYVHEILRKDKFKIIKKD